MYLICNFKTRYFENTVKEVILPQERVFTAADMSLIVLLLLYSFLKLGYFVCSMNSISYKVLLFYSSHRLHCESTYTSQQKEPICKSVSCLTEWKIVASLFYHNRCCIRLEAGWEGDNVAFMETCRPWDSKQGHTECNAYTQPFHWTSDRLWCSSSHYCVANSLARTAGTFT
jgi:hypothetical protein